MKYTHESQELNALLGKQVKIKLFDGDTAVGILRKDEHYRRKYFLQYSNPYDHYNHAGIVFYKSHLRKVELIDGYAETCFYTLVAPKGGTKEAKVEKVQGFTDGHFWYYHKMGETGGILPLAFNCWYAIDRETGLSVASGDTLDEVAQAANSETTQKALEDTKKSEKYYDDRCLYTYLVYKEIGL